MSSKVMMMMCDHTHNTLSIPFRPRDRLLGTMRSSVLLSLSPGGKFRKKLQTCQEVSLGTGREDRQTHAFPLSDGLNAAFFCLQNDFYAQRRRRQENINSF